MRDPKLRTRDINQEKVMPAAGLEGHNYRLAVDEHGNHGYEVGYWTAGEDPRYVVVARVFDQQEAARLANQFNAEPPPDHLPPGEGSDEDDAPHKARAAAHHPRAAQRK
jgi:hypothetical protein